MAKINVNAKALRDFIDSIIQWQSYFDEITYSYENINKRVTKKINSIKEKNFRLLCIRRNNYIKAVDEYNKMFSEISKYSNNNARYNNSYYELLAPYQQNINLCKSLLSESESLEKEINRLSDSFESIYKFNKDNIFNEISFLEDWIKKSDANLSEFADVTQKSEEETNENGVASTVTKSVNGINCQTVIKAIDSSQDEYLSCIYKHLKKDNQRFQYYKDNIKLSKLEGLSKTNQEWHTDGDFTVFNSPNETGKMLDSRQGKLSNFLGTCGCVSCVNVLRLAGINITEEELVGYAATHDDETGNALCSYGSKNFEENGATSALDRKHILEAYGVDSELVQPTIDNIIQAVSEGKGVIASVHADFLYNGKIRDDDFHAVTITSVKYKNGKPYSIITCDSNERPNAEYYYAAFKNALTGNPLNVTSVIIR